MKFKVGDTVRCMKTYTEYPNMRKGRILTIYGYKDKEFPMFKELLDMGDLNYWDDDNFELFEKAKEKDDVVNRPSHYTQGKIEVIDFIEDQKLDFRAANVIKYTCRARYKGKQLEDLKKARFYLDRLIKELESK